MMSVAPSSMLRRSLRNVRDAPPDKLTRRVCEGYLYSISQSLRDPVRVAATLLVGPNGITTPARSPATASICLSATRMDRRTTAVSNDRHVYTSRYHHSLSLRREKKKAAFLRLARRPSHLRLSPACHRRHVPSRGRR